jgi:hypothetical protein
MRFIILFIITSMLLGCGVHQSYHKKRVLNNRIPYGDVSPGHVFDFPEFTMQLPEFKKEPRWRHFGDKKFPSNFGLSAGIASDLHVTRFYARYAISIKKKEIDCDISNLSDAINCVENESFDYKWNHDLIQLESSNGDICLTNRSKAASTEDKGLFMYQAACLNKDMKSLVVFNASEFKEYTTPNPEYADFAFRFFSSFRSK